MYTDLPFFNKCCFCAPLRLGILVWAYLKLVFNIIILSLFLLGLFFSSVLLEDHLLLIFLALYFITIIILIFDVIFNIVLINGLHQKNVSTLRLYSCYGSTYIVVMVIYFLLSTGFMLKISVQPDVNPSLSLIYVAGAIVTFVLVLHCYLLILIQSEIRKLKGNAQLKIENCTEDLSCKKEPIVHV